MKTKIWLAAVALSLGLFVASCDNDDDNNNTTPQLNQTDKDFINKFTEGNLAEISLNQLARDSGTDSQVRNYAQMLIQDHQAAQKQLDSIASRFTLTLPTTADTASIRFFNSLSSTARGTAFDSTFIAQEIAMHDAMLTELNKASQQATQSALKDYVNRQIPVISQHRASADSIRQHL